MVYGPGRTDLIPREGKAQAARAGVLRTPGPQVTSLIERGPETDPRAGCPAARMQRCQTPPGELEQQDVTRLLALPRRAAEGDRIAGRQRGQVVDAAGRVISGAGVGVGLNARPGGVVALGSIGASHRSTLTGVSKANEFLTCDQK